MNAKDIAEYSDKVWGWVDGQVGGWVTYFPDELEKLAEAALESVPMGGTMLEIGCYSGRSTSVLLQVARERKAERVVLCDMLSWNAEEAEMHLKDVLADFKDVNWRFYPITGDILHELLTNKMTGDGQSVPPRLNKPFDFIHIDGDHYSMDKDCETWLPHLRSGGNVALHDYNPHSTIGFHMLPKVDPILEKFGMERIWQGGYWGLLTARKP